MLMLKKLLDKDSMLLGVVLGLIVPVIFYFVFIYVNLLLSHLAHRETVFTIPTMRVVAIVMNVLVFRLYMLRWERDRTGRGILLSTFIYAFLYFYFYLER